MHRNTSTADDGHPFNIITLTIQFSNIEFYFWHSVEGLKANVHKMYRFSIFINILLPMRNSFAIIPFSVIPQIFRSRTTAFSNLPYVFPFENG
jgi:hypothetical protein